MADEEDASVETPPDWDMEVSKGESDSDDKKEEEDGFAASVKAPPSLASAKA
jgi:hypothetical protein